MRLAIIGGGNVGGTLGTAWAQKAGYEIFFAVRNPTSDQTRAVVRRLNGRARAGTPKCLITSLSRFEKPCSRRSVKSFREKWAKRENSGLSARCRKCRALTSAEPKTGGAFIDYTPCSHLGPGFDRKAGTGATRLTTNPIRGVEKPPGTEAPIKRLS
jgi:hypothetical protein